MRIVDGTSELQSLENLGYDDATVERLKKALKRPDGLVLFSGPTASGKTTALYASLHLLRNGRTNIVTVEDPVERYVEGVNQIPRAQGGRNRICAGAAFGAAAGPERHHDWRDP